MEQLKFFRADESAIYPTRGTKQSAGIDFYIPNPTSCDDFIISYMYNTIFNSDEHKYKLEDVKKKYEVIKERDVKEAFWHLLKWYDFVKFGICLPVNIFSTDYRKDVFVLPEGKNIVIPTGITANIPHGKCLTFFNKSGIAAKNSLLVGSQVIDEDYTGIIHIDLHNVSDEVQMIECGQKVAQAIIMDTHIDDVELINCEGNNDKGKTERGSGGFGSTGK